ncbi:MAG: hypothetical protein CMP56_03975, partial [Flavobacteriales bacterium]|nr:hypothetical protein [Flavobacteriales bacterium]
MSGRQTNIPARRISSGTTSEREAMNDNSYGHIRYNTDEHYLEIYHSDSNNPTGWRDIITNNKDEIDLSGLLVGDDASFNVFLKVPDISLNTIHALDGNVITLTEDVYINGGLMISDICVNNIKALNGGKIIINSDLSINNKLSGTEASFNMISVHQLFGNSPIEVMDDISFNGDISCNNIVFSGVIKNAAGEEVGAALDVALMKDSVVDTSFEKISWLRFDKDSHFDLSDGGGIDSSYLDIKITSFGDISAHVSDLSINFIDLSNNFHDLSDTYYELSGAVTKNITSISDMSAHVSDLSINFIDLSKNFHDLSGTYYELSG